MINSWSILSGGFYLCDLNRFSAGCLLFSRFIFYVAGNWLLGFKAVDSGSTAYVESLSWKGLFVGSTVAGFECKLLESSATVNLLAFSLPNCLFIILS